ncbi:2-C-methyl-D-erythritol 4-phosphate cytidylyltransferase [Clostridium carboxidivorans P7]|uniref:2-C-methyl-D-erythritol 4-phosphate cytidylyltransferase n=1 Tax=Clostridium carboxidivorans P7 TaxID=536227 RepID=C6PZC8_9CLOT|nr:2-C-methyl-D-erythritol 4-phosphate cytidylyltransferase [Clostridium carboxidivorans]AKN33002.1 2-C-methyl-D-erythritol 4-phosphate cytidylyltransferase [Clostridium carboxidivorans P7]EET85408.1 2-C-methyl-D-erythritol 4-phosphate cytidylyltransferase [Clostridium carboxidivorans P7]EFG87552.1 2-C-methyl-D-erythritol 4-phosphate cytidylyltransferase [Clostridium carboxidivorans P7]
MGKNYAIILAAGKGKRMGAGINKQFLNIKDKPILYYSLKTFSDSPFIDEIILVCSSSEIDYCKEQVVGKYGIRKVLRIVSGGKERQDSVLNGLRSITDCNIVLIHDGARPFVNSSIIENGIKYAETYGACTCGINSKDTIKVKGSDGFSLDTLDRSKLFCVQTPQCFKYDLIIKCHEKLIQDKVSVTDDTAVVERYGNKVYLYEGSYNNIKITTQEDLVVAERMLEKN